MTVAWPEPWYAVADAAMRAVLERQLAAEVAAGHVLAGLAVTLLARRDGSDDALFRLADGRVAEVHMIWRQTRETDARWPRCAVFESLEAWLAGSGQGAGNN